MCFAIALHRLKIKPVKPFLTSFLLFYVFAVFSVLIDVDTGGGGKTRILSVQR